MPDILQRILAVKAKEITAAKTQRPLSAMRIAAAGHARTARLRGRLCARKLRRARRR
jgi:hypothetical protein